MIVGLNASQARAKSNQDLLIYNESIAIMNEIITASAAGYYEVVVSDKSTMTDATPILIKQGTVTNPVIVPGSTLVVNGSTVTLGTSGSNLNAIVADINDAQISGLVASKDSGYLVLTITLPETDWSFSIGNGTANTALGLTEVYGTASNPISCKYFDVWQGTYTDRAKQSQMDEVIRYFENLGYKIQRRTNTKTNKTFDWYVFW